MHIRCICSSNIIYNYVHTGTDTSMHACVYECVMHVYVCSVHSPSLVDTSLVSLKDKCEMLRWKCSLLRLCRAGGCELATGLGLGEVEWQCCQKLVTSQLRRGRHKARCAPQCSVRIVRCGVTFRIMESVSVNCKPQCCGRWPEWITLRSSLHQTFVSTLACEAPCCLAPTGLAGHELPSHMGPSARRVCQALSKAQAAAEYSPAFSITDYAEHTQYGLLLLRASCSSLFCALANRVRTL